MARLSKQENAEKISIDVFNVSFIVIYFDHLKVN